MKPGCFYIKDGICVWQQETCTAMGLECKEYTPVITKQDIQGEGTEEGNNEISIRQSLYAGSR